ncbi:hypothetical protein mflW37_2990 [Mesoplasma florum W37]|uniref:Uncharacterized protein n=1 Tax=Mesoplasma florum TaxID=2151 RepID=A0AAD2PSW1_MESFO|nr:hypothetical protein [Mesoplasma florum]AGY41366.1 hypothetical protein mflW37_2990 [Mesoplasma florum W37]AVN59591.1 hypothetical protein CG008_01570 [Mesoplasma florum]AVN65706.1 hypothetical protein MflW12_3010 [Mesoplasma florum]
MKKILSLIGTTVISVSALATITYSINTTSSINRKINQIDFQEINWNDVQEESLVLFNDIKINNEKTILTRNYKMSESSDDLANTDQIFQFAQEESLKILEKFKKEKTDLTNAIDYLKDKNSEFEKTYESALNENINQNMNQKSFDNLNKTNEILSRNSLKTETFSLSANLEKNKELVKKLRLAKITFATASATAAVAAAGFYAAAWWFGITLPWAVGCTTASAFCGTAAGGISLALLKYDKKMSDLDKASSAVSGAISLAHVLSKTTTAILYTLTASVTPLTWCFPALLSVISVAGAVTAWISYNNF